MLHLLKRHPFPVRAFFDFSLVLTYALPRETLLPLVAPGLELDGEGKVGFLAIALVQTRALRPEFLPAWAGQDFFLSGYRIFTRYRRATGRSQRGLQILRSDTDRRLMKWLGNAQTHYGYQRARVSLERDASHLEVRIETPGQQADLHVIADLSSEDAALPPGSLFQSWSDARRFAGPLPHTFSYERETGSMVIVRGLREEWNPRPVAVEVRQASYFAQPAFRAAHPVLASAFYLTEIPYRWERGVVERLDGGGR
jgi:hypothetical protein